MAILNKPEFNKKTLTQEEMQQIKEFVVSRHQTKTFMSYICGIQVVWRGMTRSEYKEFLRKLDQSGDTTALDIEDVLCQHVIMHPTLGSGPNMLDLRTAPAGFASQLFNQFMAKMGFAAEPVEPIEL